MIKKLYFPIAFSIFLLVASENAHSFNLNNCGTFSQIKTPGKEGIIDFYPEGENATFVCRATEINQTYFGISEKNQVYSLDYIHDGENIYLLDFIPAASFNTFIKGTITEEGFKVIFPQPIAYGIDDNGNYIELYLNVCKHVQVKDDINQNFDTYESVSDNASREVLFHKTTSGSYEMLINGSPASNSSGLPEYIIGVVESNDGINYNWDGIGIADITLTELNKTIATLPQDADISEWSYRTVENTFGMTNIATDGDDLYIQGLSPILPTSCITGKIDGDKVTFDFPQYLGIRNGQFVNVYGEKKTGYDYSTVSSITMKYDVSQKFLTMPEDLLFSIAFENPDNNPNREARIYEYRGIVLHDQEGATFGNPPSNPVIEYYDVYNAYLVGGFFNVEMMPFDTEGYILPMEELFYTVYINGEPYTFDTDTYPELKSDLTEIPFTFSDMFNIYYFGSLHQIYIKDVVIEEFGIKLSRRDKEGNTISSELVNVFTPFSNVESVSTEEILRTEYYSLDGILTLNPSKGIYIKKEYDRNNNIKITKILIH